MKIIICGTVQGVGFRPTAYRVAKSLGIRGYVLNKGSNVEIFVDKRHDDFLRMLKDELPKIASIDDVLLKDEPCNHEYEGFEIRGSMDGSRSSTIPVDTAICDECKKELFDSKNRRYLYPFINCTACGARFSVIEEMPYDRERTSMKEFEMCKGCRDEYSNPSSRRFHAQTISCPECGPSYRLYKKDGEIIEDDPIREFANRIDDAEIGIAKSWGGMHIVCKLDEAERLRRLYARDAKPFAVMMRNFDVIREYTHLDMYGEEMLRSPERPILLLDRRRVDDIISPGLGNVGVYLPYSGMHHILFHHLKCDAIIMTSANISGEPMVISNLDALDLDADCYLLHNRKIVNRIDDSVLRLYGKRRFFLRRSRGFIPTLIKVPYLNKVVAVGAERDVSISIAADGRLTPSQYIGNARHYPTMEFLRSSMTHLMNLFGMDGIECVGIDLHPRYTTRKFGKELADAFDTRILEIQHHWAHAASLMIDNGMEKEDEIIALTLDGTGYGTDGGIWGGEILHSSFKDFKRVGYLEEIPLIGGDAAINDPRRVLFAIFDELGMDIPYFNDKESEILHKLKVSSPKTSSFGRILDALSFYLGICDKMTYEGEPAMRLERYIANGEPRYEFDAEIRGGVILTIPIFGQLIEYPSKELHEGEKADLAHSFVHSLLKAMTSIAIEDAEGEIPIGTTGGVSYNSSIVRMIDGFVRENGLELLTHDEIPNGDNGISIGQNVICGIDMMDGVV